MSDGPESSGSGSTPDAEATPERPFLRVVSGNPTDEDIAVLTAVLSAAAGATESGPADDQPRDNWGRPADLLRPEWVGGPTGFLFGRS